MEGYDRQIWNEPSALLQSKIQKQFPIKSWTLVITGHQCKIEVVKLCKHHCLEAQVITLDALTTQPPPYMTYT